MGCPLFPRSFINNNRDKKVIFLFASEVKQQMNMVNLGIDIEDFSTLEYLREDNATEG